MKLMRAVQSADQRMNWRPGMFRLWLLFTVLWLAGVCVLEFSFWRSYSAQVGEQQSLRPECRQHEAPPSCLDFNTNPPTNPFDRFDTPAPSLRGAVEFAVSAPLVLLVVGGAIGWVAGEFNRRRGA